MVETVVGASIAHVLMELGMDVAEGDRVVLGGPWQGHAQFDLQAPGTPMLGFGEGWQEPEYTPLQGLSWRWASGKAGLRIEAGGRDVELQIVGESPRRYFDRPSRVTVAAGATQLLSVEAASDFAWSVRVPASALESSGGTITIETDQFFRPADRGQGADRRALGLRIYRVMLKPAS